MVNLRTWSRSHRYRGSPLGAGTPRGRPRHRLHEEPLGGTESSFAPPSSFPTPCTTATPQQSGDFHFVPFPRPPQPRPGPVGGSSSSPAPGPHLGAPGLVPRGRPPPHFRSHRYAAPAVLGSGRREAAPVTRLGLRPGLRPGLRLHKAQGGGGRGGSACDRGGAARRGARGARGWGRHRCRGRRLERGAQSPARPRAAAKGGLDRLAARRPRAPSPPGPRLPAPGPQRPARGSAAPRPRGQRLRDPGAVYLGVLPLNSRSKSRQQSAETSSLPRQA